MSYANGTERHGEYNGCDDVDVSKISQAPVPYTESVAKAKPICARECSFPSLPYYADGFAFGTAHPHEAVACIREIGTIISDISPARAIRLHHRGRIRLDRLHNVMSSIARKRFFRDIGNPHRGKLENRFPDAGVEPGLVPSHLRIPRHQQ